MRRLYIASQRALRPFRVAVLTAGLGAATAGSAAIAQPVGEVIDRWAGDHLDQLVATYRDLHANPELSLNEVRTASVAAEHLRAAGFEVLTGVGGHGVVGLLHNGDGPTVLIRGDMDALPVVEQTGLPYASHQRVRRRDGSEVGVMHACGHDLHLSNLLGTAELLAALRDRWQGTLVIVAQPAEELGKGALMMIRDGLFDRIPTPDFALAMHVASDLPAGEIGYVSGWAAANVDTVNITIYGRGGHGARPQEANDPIVTAAALVTALQTLVSRRVAPSDTAVVTVGSFHAGTKSNVIPDKAELALTVRSYGDEVRKTLLDGIRQLADGICQAFACPQPADVWVNPDATPAVYNDPQLAERAAGVLQGLLGDGKVYRIPATMTGEDFGRYSRAGGFPGLLLRIGAVEPGQWRSAKEAGNPLPALHSSRFSPDARATLATSLRAMTTLALDLLGGPPGT